MIRTLAVVAGRAGLHPLARWLHSQRALVREVIERAPAPGFRSTGACASSPAPCAPPRLAPSLPLVGSRWTLHEGGDRPRDRVVVVTGYVNADDPRSERDPGAVVDWPVVTFTYEDTGEPGRLFLTVFNAQAGALSPEELAAARAKVPGFGPLTRADLADAETRVRAPDLRADLERLADAHDVPSVPTMRSQFDPQVAEELIRRGLARLGPARFASQREPSLDITPAGLDLYRRWSTRAGAPAEAHLEGPFNFLVYDANPEGWTRTSTNTWQRSVGDTTVQVRSQGSVFGNDARTAAQKWIVAAFNRPYNQPDAETRWHVYLWRDSLADALAAARELWRTGYEPSRNKQVDPQRGDTWELLSGERVIVLHADGWTVATANTPDALSFDWRGKGHGQTRWTPEQFRDRVYRATWQGTTEPVPGTRQRAKTGA